MTRPARKEDPDQAGFTLVELMVVMLIMSVILAMVASVAFSMSMTAKRNDSMVTIEQTASTGLAQLARDIRSAHAISFPANSPTTQVLLQENQVGGGYTYVEWTYDSGTSTLTRSTSSSSGGPFTVTGPTVGSVTNGASGVFTYYNVLGADISSGLSPSTPLTIQNCTARIGVQLDVSTSTVGVPTFQASEDVALTDQVDIISLPGNGQC